MFIDHEEEYSNPLWFLDSGCSHHMTGVNESFTQLDESFHLEVTLGDKKKLQVSGKGTVCIPISNKTSKLLEDVYYIPSLEYNLLSVGQLMAKGYVILFDEGTCTITHKPSGVPLMTIKMAKNNLFIIDASKITVRPTSPQSTLEADSRLWLHLANLAHMETDRSFLLFFFLVLVPIYPDGDRLAIHASIDDRVSRY
ncbi:hypothetical protein E3N88_29551 [Mikania micrantha]|uniref:Retrovirus-related Pol polyprotein from transposon TNT 1-94-like beta-barrel domain-containing protein n=1 Tax=Mikania micrantha TaxID=192012 RepID=A0A5N6MJR7_9ASTR|nr:hypothetical protein E3N88_29551 [Mikania micrantha]